MKRSPSSTAPRTARTSTPCRVATSNPANPSIRLSRANSTKLGLDLTGAGGIPHLTWIQDAMVTRPGSTPPRKLHLVFRVHIDNSTRARLRTVEHDDTAGAGHLIWSHYKDTADKALFPPVPLAKLATPTAPLDAALALLPTLDDTNYRWI